MGRPRVLEYWTLLYMGFSLGWPKREKIKNTTLFYNAAHTHWNRYYLLIFVQNAIQKTSLNGFENNDDIIYFIQAISQQNVVQSLSVP